MTASAELLWRVNNEYRRRLSKARNTLDLLDLLLARRGDSGLPIRETLREMRTQLHGIADEHRSWRYSFFYATSEDKRMVQDVRDVMRALAHFSRMSRHHRQRLVEIQQMLAAADRPRRNLTGVPGGDLWDLTQSALDDVIDFLSSPTATP